MSKQPDHLAARLSALSPEQRVRLKSILGRKMMTGDSAKTILCARHTTVAPLSFAQLRVRFLDQLEPGRPLYNLPAAMRILGTLDIPALTASLTEIVRRHDTLRTIFSTVDNEPVQVINTTVPFALSEQDLSDRPPESWDTEANHWVSVEVQHPFELSSGPVFRASLLCFATHTHVLILNVHHIVADGWSISILHRELGTLYQAFAAGKRSPLPEPPIRYADYAIWQRAWLQGALLDKQCAYWRDILRGAPTVLTLPADRLPCAVQNFSSARQFLHLSRELTDALKEFSRANGATLFMTLLAAFKMLLSQYCNQHDIVVGSPFANRNHVATENLIGLFVNVLALRTDCSGNPGFRELLSRVRTTVMGAYDHPDLPFDTLVEFLQPEYSLRHFPLFQVMFNFQNMPIHPLQLSGLDLYALAADNTTTDTPEAQHFSEFSQGNGTGRFDVSLFIWEQADRLRGRLMYNTDLFDASTMICMLTHLETLLNNITAQPNARLSELTEMLNPKFCTSKAHT